MNTETALNTVRELGHIFAVSLAEKTGKSSTDNDLMNGLAAYEILSLKGEFEDLDKSVDIILRIVYEQAKLMLNKE